MDALLLLTLMDTTALVKSAICLESLDVWFQLALVNLCSSRMNTEIRSLLLLLISMLQIWSLAHNGVQLSFTVLLIIPVWFVRNLSKPIK